MHSGEPGCDHDWGNSEPWEGSRLRLNFRCMMGSERIYACCVQNNNNSSHDDDDNNTIQKSLVRKSHAHTHARTPASHAWPRIFVCMGRIRISLPGWAVHLRLRMHSPLYGQCRSINNATLAEVKGGLRVWRRRSGEAEEGRARQREQGDGQTAETCRDKKETNVSL